MKIFTYYSLIIIKCLLSHDLWRGENPQVKLSIFDDQRSLLGFPHIEMMYGSQYLSLYTLIYLYINLSLHIYTLIYLTLIISLQYLHYYYINILNILMKLTQILRNILIGSVA